MAGLDRRRNQLKFKSTSFIKKLMSRLVELARRSVTRTTAAIKAEQVASSAFCHEHACAVFTSAHH